MATFSTVSLEDARRAVLPPRRATQEAYRQYVRNLTPDSAGQLELGEGDRPITERARQSPKALSSSGRFSWRLPLSTECRRASSLLIAAQSRKPGDRAPCRTQALGHKADGPGLWASAQISSVRRPREVLQPPQAGGCRGTCAGRQAVVHRAICSVG